MQTTALPRSSPKHTAGGLCSRVPLCGCHHDFTLSGPEVADAVNVQFFGLPFVDCRIPRSHSAVL